MLASVGAVFALIPSVSPAGPERLRRVAHGRTAVTIHDKLGSSRRCNYIIPPVRLSDACGFAKFGRPHTRSCSHHNGPAHSIIRHTLTRLRNNTNTMLAGANVSTVRLMAAIFLGPNSLLMTPRSYCNNDCHLFSDLTGHNYCHILFISRNSRRTLQTTLTRGPGLMLMRDPDGPLLHIISVTGVYRLTERIKTIDIISGAFLDPTLRGPLTLNTSLILRSYAGCLGNRSSIITNIIVTGSPSIIARLT